ncbi:MAG: hypothetical protein ACP5UN_00305 [Candidatus Micrarchaeia archaeon]
MELNENEASLQYVEEDGKKYRMPYKLIKKIKFNNLDPKELIDIAHCARLQYRLLNFDAIIKAKIEFVKKSIDIIYNPPDADNKKAKMSKEDIIKFLNQQGIHPKPENIEERDFDYYKEFYSKAYFPESIRHAIPYGWKKEEYEKAIK